jgi:hypothetical protein
MSVKRLLPLVALLIILVGLAVVLKRQPASPSLTEEAGLVRLTPVNVRADSISGFDLYHGAQPQEVVRVRKRDGAWILSSHFDAPAQTKALQELFTHLSTLSGELRADAAETLSAFQLDDAQALHLLLYTDNPDTPAVHLLAGKGSGQNGFMRRDGETRVYYVDLNLRTRAGLQGDKATEPLSAKAWADLQPLDVPPDTVTAIALQTPTHNLRFVRPVATSSPQPDAAQTAPTTPPWTLAAPEMTYAIKQDAVTRLVSTWSTLKADDIADPAKAAQYGFDTPAARATLTVQETGKEPGQLSVMIGQEGTEPNSKRYLRVGETGPLYLLPTWAWSRLFPSLGTLLELHVLQIPAEEVTHVTLQQHGDSWSLERLPAPPGPTTEAAPTQPEWQRVEAPDIPVDVDTITTLLEAVSQLTADDIVQQPTPPGLDTPTWTLALTRRDGQTTRLALSQVSEGNTNRYYAKVHDAPEIFVLSEATYKQVTDALTQLQPASSDTSLTPPTKPEGGGTPSSR